MKPLARLFLLLIFQIPLYSWKVNCIPIKGNTVESNRQSNSMHGAFKSFVVEHETNVPLESRNDEEQVDENDRQKAFNLAVGLVSRVFRMHFNDGFLLNNQSVLHVIDRESRQLDSEDQATEKNEDSLAVKKVLLRKTMNLAARILRCEVESLADQIEGCRNGRKEGRANKDSFFTWLSNRKYPSHNRDAVTPNKILRRPGIKKHGTSVPKAPSKRIMSIRTEGVTCSTIDGCGKCTGLTSQGGKIESPNYPSEYGNNLACKYIIEAPVGARIKFIFTRFYLEEDYDFISFADKSERPIRVLMSGYEIPNDVLAKTNYVTMRFTTDSDNYGMPLSLIGLWTLTYTIIYPPTDMPSTTQSLSDLTISTETTKEETTTVEVTIPTETTTTEETTIGEGTIAEDTTSTEATTREQTTSAEGTTSTERTTTKETTIGEGTISTETTTTEETTIAEGTTSTETTTTMETTTAEGTTSTETTTTKETTVGEGTIPTETTTTEETTTVEGITSTETTTTMETTTAEGTTSTETTTTEQKTTAEGTVPTETTTTEGTIASSEITTTEGTTTSSETTTTEETTTATGAVPTEATTTEGTTTSTETSTREETTTAEGTISTETTTTKETTIGEGTVPTETTTSTESTTSSEGKTTSDETTVTEGTTTAELTTAIEETTPTPLEVSCVSNCYSCSNITEKGGYVRSPWFPDDYEPNVKCKTIIDVPAYHKIRIDFSDMIIEDSFDFFKVYNGDKMLRELTGYEIPDPFIIKSNKAVFDFESDDDNGSIPGWYYYLAWGFWQFHFTVIPPDTTTSTTVQQTESAPATEGTTTTTFTPEGLDYEYSTNCDGGVFVNVSLSGGIIQSPNYPNEYLPDQLCDFTLTFTRRRVIQLDFEDFYVEENYDMIHIMRPDDSLIVYGLTGYTNPEIIVVKENAIVILIVTDQDNSGNLRPQKIPRFQIKFTLSTSAVINESPSTVTSRATKTTSTVTSEDTDMTTVALHRDLLK